MRPLLLLFSLLCISPALLAQVPDFLSVRRKNGRTIKTFYAGSTINFITRSGIPVSGTIQTMRNDTLFISTYATRIALTRLGVTVVDTFAWRVEKVHYKQIGRIEIFTKHRGIYGRIGTLLAIGGGGYIFLNVFNGLTQGGSITDKENMQRLKTAATVAAVGTLLRVLYKNNTLSRRRHRIVYINLQPAKAF